VSADVDINRLAGIPTVKSNQLLGMAIAALTVAALPAQAANVAVGVSIGINQPGVYGRIDIGRFAQPQVVVQRPVVITRQTRAREPVYLWAPPGHQQHWRQHCGQYQACGMPVYFVQERWYQDHVMQPVRRDRYDRAGDRREDWRDDRRDDRRGDRGQGKGHGGRD